jgi:hypothetical protein
VVKFYVDGGVKNEHLSDLMIPVELTEPEQKDLILFLRALTSGTPAPKGYDACEELLREGRHAEAYEAFLAALDQTHDPLRVATGLTGAALALDFT